MKIKTEIRVANPNDLKAIQSIAKHTIDKNYRKFLGDEGVDWFLYGPCDEYLKENLNQTIALYGDGSVVGFSICKDNSIDLMMINHEQHRIGFGSLLLEYCEKVLFQQYPEIKLESFEDNGKANTFYRKNGWIQKGHIFDETSKAYKLVFIKKHNNSIQRT